ncbi:Lrp/AsnC family transcriptional regulator [Peribacillus sp. RS7]|uniref:Lrp/AsnC family transcriptional regulator n=1 Tax=unclassified Peribacillus TaxID=2675266 RepID=UPI0025A00A30|nr:Lrp/AsnC family transcriptional regulator [Peribacillus sp. ACCC06369]MDM5360600.1 Lrp/AsnC family transcriptional regulator [Peribacillus sp. ACCC06369]
MDRTDKKILSLLENNGRMSMKELAHEVSLTAPATKERVNKLEESGVIKGYKTEISLEKLDRSITAFILFETDRCKDFYNFSLSHPDVLECHRLAGQYSYLIKISTFSMETLEEFVDEAIKYGKSSTHLIFSSATNNVFSGEDVTQL